MISNKIATKQCFPILHNPNKNLWNNLFDSYYYASKRDNKMKRNARKARKIEIDGRRWIARSWNDLYRRSNDFARWLSNFVRLFFVRVGVREKGDTFLKIDGLGWKSIARKPEVKIVSHRSRHANSFHCFLLPFSSVNYWFNDKKKGK